MKLNGHENVASPMQAELDRASGGAQQATSVENFPVCIWHAGCLDGFTSAWICHHAFNDHLVYHEGVYEDDPPWDLIRGRNVLMVDFSYQRPVIEAMQKIARSILILDHHKTAFEDLKPFIQAFPRHSPSFPAHGQCIAHFDMERSGAGITWDFFNPLAERPELVNFVEDRDLWKFAREESKTVCYALASYPFEFKTWDVLAAGCQDADALNVILREGMAVERTRLDDQARLINLTIRPMKIGTLWLPTCNVPHFYASDIGNSLARLDSNATKAAATYFDGKKERIFSLRSIAGGPDVGAIAAAYGGGGHAHAAGFKREIGWEGEIEPPAFLAKEP